MGNHVAVLWTNERSESGDFVANHLRAAGIEVWSVMDILGDTWDLVLPVKVREAKAVVIVGEIGDDPYRTEDALATIQRGAPLKLVSASDAIALATEVLEWIRAGCPRRE